MKLIADSGSTKTEWVMMDGEVEKLRILTPGINPIQMGVEEIRSIIRNFADDNPIVLRADTVEFFGSGCTPRGSEIIKAILADTFAKASDIVVGSDIIGAARALLGDRMGIACILGTGANSCLWDGEKVIAQTPAMGFILGDEGGGAVLGKSLLNLLYKGGNSAVDACGSANSLFALRQEFENTYALTLADIIERVYRRPNANRWLATLSPFVAAHLDVPQVREMVVENFRRFFRNNISPYARPDLPVNFVGSIAWHYRNLLCEAADAEGFTLGTILQKPL